MSQRNWTSLASSVLVATYAAPVLAQQPSTAPAPPQWYGPGPWHMMGEGFGWHLWFMPFFMLFFLVALAVSILVVMYGLRAWSHGMHHHGPHWHAPGGRWQPPSYSALQVLNERYAKGEIAKEEYEEKKAAILSGGPQ